MGDCVLPLTTGEFLIGDPEPLSAGEDVPEIKSNRDTIHPIPNFEIENNYNMIS